MRLSSFTILLVLFLNYFLVFEMKIIENSLFLILFLTLFGSLFFLLISSKILKPIFQSEENIKNSIKNRLHELNIPTSTIKINLHLLKKDLNARSTLNCAFCRTWDCAELRVFLSNFHSVSFLFVS